MYGENYVWLLIATPAMTSDWWVPDPAEEDGCTRDQVQSALDYQFIFYYKNEVDGTMISGKVNRT